MSSLLSLPEDVKLAAYPFLAESIVLVANHARAKWGLTPHTSEGFIRLNVVMTEVLTIGPNTVRVFVNETAARQIPAVVSGELKLEGREGPNDIDDFYPSSPGSRLVQVLRGPAQRDLLAQLKNAHEENIRVTAMRGGLGRTIRSAHSDEAVREIGDFLGRELPIPLYSQDQAADVSDSPEKVAAGLEGASREMVSVRRERNAKNRREAVRIHGVTCQCCGFNFEAVYGGHGAEYIQVHHIDQLSANPGEVLVDPKSDLAVLCANCHAMIHRDRSRPPLSMEEVRAITNDRYGKMMKTEFALRK